MNSRQQLWYRWLGGVTRSAKDILWVQATDAGYFVTVTCYSGLFSYRFSIIMRLFVKSYVPVLCCAVHVTISTGWHLCIKQCEHVWKTHVFVWFDEGSWPLFFLPGVILLHILVALCQTVLHAHCMAKLTKHSDIIIVFCVTVDSFTSCSLCIHWSILQSFVLELLLCCVCRVKKSVCDCNIVILMFQWGAGLCLTE